MADDKNHSNADHAASLFQLPTFQLLARQQSRLVWSLTGVTLLLYYGFILLIAFSPTTLGTPLSENGVTTVGMPVGVALIFALMALTGLYVYRANRGMDALLRQIKEETGL